jgi:hypothetical protein
MTANLLRTQVGLMPPSFTFYNSWWRNLALVVLFGALAALCIPLGFDAIFRDKALPIEFVVVGFGIFMFVGTLVCGFRLFDRRLKVKIDADGVCDYRTSVGNIPWSEVSDFQLRSLKGSTFVALALRSPERWIARANAITRFIVSLMGSKRFRINISLHNMAVKEDELGAFMTYMIAQASVRAKPGAQSAENAS